MIQAPAPTMTRLIGVCSSPNCPVVHAVSDDPEMAGQGDLFGDDGPAVVVAAGARPQCHRHGALRWTKVTGRLSVSRRCDSRCLYAKGADCECSCSGSNHGAGWEWAASWAPSAA